MSGARGLRAGSVHRSGGNPAILGTIAAAWLLPQGRRKTARAKKTAMAKKMATEMLVDELRSTLDKMSRDFDRVELLAAGLAAMSRPIPDYEPEFQHLNRAALRDHEFTAPAGRDRPRS